jgi:hypothetical protein
MSIHHDIEAACVFNLKTPVAINAPVATGR